MVALVALALAVAPGADLVEPPTSVHAAELEAHRGHPGLAARPRPGAGRDVRDDEGLSKVVYGFLPYWQSAAEVRWDRLTHLAYFGAELEADGSIVEDHGWGLAGADLVLEAHAANVLVTLTAIEFEPATLEALLGSSAARSAAIDNLVASVVAQGADGITLDFERLPYSRKAELVSFVTELRAALTAAVPGGHLGVVTPAVDWAGSYDYDLLAINSDALLVMAYDYHWRGGNPGPVAPISAGTRWSGPDILGTIDEYLTWGGVENKERFILGVPLYGYNWPATSSAVPGTRAAGDVTAPSLTSCSQSFAADKQWDADAQSPYRVYTQSTGVRQLFCEDQESLAAKLDLVDSHQWGGAMLWAVGYAEPSDPFWEELGTRWGVVPSNYSPVARIVGPSSALAGAWFTLDAGGSSDVEGGPLTFAWTQESGPAGTLESTSGDRTRVRVAAPGTCRFAVAVSDGTATTVATHTVEVNAAPAPADDGCAASPSPLTALLAALALARRRR